MIGRGGSLLPRRFGTSETRASGRISRPVPGARGPLALHRWAPGFVERPARAMARGAPHAQMGSLGVQEKTSHQFKLPKMAKGEGFGLGHPPANIPLSTTQRPSRGGHSRIPAASAQWLPFDDHKNGSTKKMAPDAISRLAFPSSSNASDLQSSALSSQRPSSYLQGSSTTIPRCSTFILDKRDLWLAHAVPVTTDHLKASLPRSLTSATSSE